MFIVLVRYNNALPMVASSNVMLDSDYNYYVDLSDKLSDAFKSTDDNYFKAVKKSFSYNKAYKVTKINL